MEKAPAVSAITELVVPISEIVANGIEVPPSSVTRPVTVIVCAFERMEKSNRKEQRNRCFLMV
jgi:hypothetical protein